MNDDSRRCFGLVVGVVAIDFAEQMEGICAKSTGGWDRRPESRPIADPPPPALFIISRGAQTTSSFFT